jgi:hypothetical protein
MADSSSPEGSLDIQSPEYEVPELLYSKEQEQELDQLGSSKDEGSKTMLSEPLSFTNMPSVSVSSEAPDDTRLGSSLKSPGLFGVSDVYTR